MARPTPDELPPVAVAAGNLFSGVVDGLAAAMGKGLDAQISNALAGLTGAISFGGDVGGAGQQVASSSVPNLNGPGESRGV
jgi:hypothetical protein